MFENFSNCFESNKHIIKTTTCFYSRLLRSVPKLHSIWQLPAPTGILLKI